LPVEEVDTVIELRPTACQQCGQLLLGDDPDPARHQVSEIPPVKAEVTEYCQHRLSCPACGEVTAAEWPHEMPTGNFGPRAQAVIGYLTGRLGLSHRYVVEAMAALHGLSLSLGSVSTIQDHVSKALEQPVRTAQQYVHRQPVNHLDETIWPEGEKQKMERVQARVKELIQGGVACDQAKTRRTCENLLKHEVSLWTFMREEGVEPTNNNAERPLRRAVLWRRKSFGTQSENGSRFVERILTAVTSLRQQGRDVLEYLTAVCRAALGQPSACCLLPNSS